MVTISELRWNLLMDKEMVVNTAVKDVLVLLTFSIFVQLNSELSMLKVIQWPVIPLVELSTPMNIAVEEHTVLQTLANLPIGQLITPLSLNKIVQMLTVMLMMIIRVHLLVKPKNM